MRPSGMFWILLVCFGLFTGACAKADQAEQSAKPSGSPAAAAPGKPADTAAPSPVHEIKSEKELDAVLKEAGDKLLVMDLYADWCLPCRKLAPILEDLARETDDSVRFLKVNIDEQPAIATRYQVRGIPFVVFVKNGRTVQAIMGVRTRDDYLRAIRASGAAKPKDKRAKADGKLVEGRRVIEFAPGADPVNIYVYRGDTVNLKFKAKDYPFSVSIPAFKVSQEAAKDEQMDITFKAKQVGTFDLFCNGACPAGDGARHATIIVMQFESAGDTVYKELTAPEARELITEKEPVILDVRTPREYYAGHIENARLLPLQQLQRRISEIEDLKDRDILLYCRSGNRSTVASEILKGQGFKKLYNLRTGMRGWMAEEYPVIK